MGLRVLDLYCGGGGAARGYAAAGFEVVGVDCVEQAYPFAFHQADAIAYLLAHGREFDLIHASPPCQSYSAHVHSPGIWDRTRGYNAPRLINATREAALAIGRPFVIENVIGAVNVMGFSIILCGTMFGLPVTRHRLFETSFAALAPGHPGCGGVAKRYAQSRCWDERDMRVSGKGRRAGTASRWKEILGIDADAPMTLHQLRECIPPAYTRYMGDLASRFIADELASV